MKFFASIAAISTKIKHDKINAFAAESALFIIMSFIPCLILLMLIVKYTPLTEELILNFVNDVVPSAFVPTATKHIHDAYTDANFTMILISGISLIWAAGKGFVSLIDGLNAIFNIKEHRNWFVIRLYAILYTIIFLVIILLCVVIYVLGYRINDFFKVKAPVISDILDKILAFRALIVIFVLTVLFTFLYVAIPNRHTKIKRQFPGALFSAVGWTGFSFFFSLYFKYSSRLSEIYGSLTTIVCVMLWLYVCMYIFLMGAEINLYVEQWNAGSSIKEATDITHKH